MKKESDIVYQNKKFWVLLDKKQGFYHVMVDGATAASSDSSFAITDAGLLIAKRRCDYLAGSK